jgi:hypothetical protein
METKDICSSCGNQLEYELWGAKCHCPNPNVVHQQPCDLCGKLIGYIIDDDYCTPEKLICPDCLNKTRKG